MFGKEGEIERFLRVEVAVQHGLRHPRRSRDVVEAGGGVAMLGKEWRCHLLDLGAALVGRKPSSGTAHCYRGVTYCGKLFVCKLPPSYEGGSICSRGWPRRPSRATWRACAPAITDRS